MTGCILIGSSWFSPLTKPSLNDTHLLSMDKTSGSYGSMIPSCSGLCDRWRSRVVVFEANTFKRIDQEWHGQTKPKVSNRQFMNFSQGHSGTEVRCESCLFS